MWIVENIVGFRGLKRLEIWQFLGVWCIPAVEMPLHFVEKPQFKIISFQFFNIDLTHI